MKNFVLNDKLNRKRFYKIEHRRVILSYLSKSDLFSLNLRYRASSKLSRLSKKVKVSRIKNYCILTGRSGSVGRDFRLSRIKFRELSLSGHLYGVTKSSW